MSSKNSAQYEALAASWQDHRDPPARNAAENLKVPVVQKLESSLSPRVLDGVLADAGSNHGQHVPQGLRQQGYRTSRPARPFCSLDLRWKHCSHGICRLQRA